jgi:hypothetical protein
VAWIEGPARTIAAIVEEMASASDDELLTTLAALDPLPDESDPQWIDETFWFTVAYRFLGLAQAARLRRLRPAVRLILERACYGDPGETMRGLRHVFEAIYEPEWGLLADEYLPLARSDRLGTRMWAIAGLMIVDDPRAIWVFEESVREDPKGIREYAIIGLERLGRARETAK